VKENIFKKNGFFVKKRFYFIKNNVLYGCRVKKKTSTSNNKRGKR
tara:strand:- start:303 stop:437 length:135 start_codon:yes stop_codon:yes gene_type:complete